ncbi:DUF2840 domain-containing protein [Zavarzinia sp.]|uniref:DUF2840 domain-containing protein n=1 Tax=Zavarzinia sp. TaxID=2027920 RepID=UPI003BB5A92A
MMSATDPFAGLTEVELTWREKQCEYWLRFGDYIAERTLDRHRRVVGFAPDAVFAFARWTASDSGAVFSRLDILRALPTGAPYQTLPFVRPGAEILLTAQGGSKVEQVFRLIDAIEAQGVPPAAVAPEYWRHMHHRLLAGGDPRPYTLLRHRAWLKRRSIRP